VRMHLVTGLLKRGDHPWAEGVSKTLVLASIMFMVKSTNYLTSHIGQTMSAHNVHFDPNAKDYSTSDFGTGGVINGKT
jgi:hypothetical protein